MRRTRFLLLLTVSLFIATAALLLWTVTTTGSVYVTVFVTAAMAFQLHNFFRLLRIERTEKQVAAIHREYERLDRRMREP